MTDKITTIQPDYLVKIEIMVDRAYNLGYDDAQTGKEVGFKQLRQIEDELKSFVQPADRITDASKKESKFTREFVYTLMKLNNQEQWAVKSAFEAWNDEEYWHGVGKHNIGSLVGTWVRKLTEWGKGQ